MERGQRGAAMPMVNWSTVITGLVSAALLGCIKWLIDLVKRMDKKMDDLMGATQSTMRATLIHNYEKYMDREWLTPEERASWYDMHDKYSAMGFNGLIDSYRHKLDQLPDREI
jgi:hypothetical protein